MRRARSLFASGYRLLPMLDRRSGACVAAMAGIYRRLLDRIARDPHAVLRGRVSLPGREKAYVAVRGLSGLDARTVSRHLVRGARDRPPPPAPGCGARPAPGAPPAAAPSWSAAASPASPRRCGSPTPAYGSPCWRRPRLGGLAFSFRRGELTVDNGQHVYMRCCTAYRWFLDEVGGADLAPAAGPAGRTGRRRGPARGPPPRPAPQDRPAHPAAPGRRPRDLSAPLLADRARAGRAALALKALDPADPALDGTDFATWLARHGQSPRAVEALWDLVGVATLNAPAADSSLGLAAMVFRTGLLSDPGAADLGWARVPLGHLHDTLARAASKPAASAS